MLTRPKTNTIPKARDPHAWVQTHPFPVTLNVMAFASAEAKPSWGNST
jgi:hypothetical protein